MRWLGGISDSMGMSLSRPQELVTEKTGVLQSMGTQRVGHDGATERTKYFINIKMGQILHAVL